MRSIVAQWSDRPGRDVFGHRQGTCLMGAVDVAGEWLGGNFGVRRSAGGAYWCMAGELALFR